MPTPLIIAQVRVVPAKADLDANLERLLRTLDRLAPLRPDVVVTPEGFLDGYAATEDAVTAQGLSRYAIDPEDSPYTDIVGAWASDHGAWVVLGCTRRVVDGGRQRGANTALVFDRGGRLAGHYDKTHLQYHDHKYVPGRALPAFAADFGVFGVLICADRRWPEAVRTLALKGARVIFNPTYGMTGQFNTAMMRVRAYESEVFLAFTHPTQSLITGPGGRILCDRVDGRGTFAVTTIDLDEVDAARGGAASHLRDCRPELYTPSGR